MTCDREMLLLISSYADGEATPEEAERAAEHLERCTGCHKMVEQWQGHQQLFTWAYTREITDGCAVDALIRQAGKEQSMTEEPMPRKAAQERKTIIILPHRWKWVAALAAVLFIAFTAYAVITHSWIKVGQQVVTAMQPRETRMAINVGLTIGPHSIIRRTGPHTLRVEQGWVATDVRNGAGVTIETPRLRATDRGTKFHVGTGAKADYVTVEKGAVEVKIGVARRTVNAGQALFANADGTYTELTAPTEKPDKDKRAPLRANLTDVPTTIEARQWEEGIARLAISFPNLHLDGGRGTSCSRDNKVDYIIGFEDITKADYRQALRAHFPQLAHLLAGGTGDTGTWDIPVGVMQLAGITSPSGLADDVYYLRLAPAKGNILVWRFSGSRGTDVDVPVTFNKAWPHLFPSSGMLQQAGSETIEHPGGKNEYIGKYLLVDWPVTQKPYLEFRVNGPQELALWQEERVMLAEVARQCAGVPELSLRYPNDQYYYLDADRKHRLMIAWNQDAGRQLAQVSDRAKTERGAAVILAVINTELPLADPPAPAGIYLLRLVLLAGKSPFLEMSTPGNQRMPTWGAPSRILLAGKPDDNGGGHSFSNALNMPRRYGRVEVECRLGSVYNGAFPFTFKVFDRSKGAWPGKMWTEGWIRIKKL